MKWLQNKVALVTGGGSGIGAAIVRRFIAEGARVGVLDLSAERLEALAREFPDDVVTIAGDVRSLADNERAVAKTVEAFGKLDTFVGHAGVFDGFQRLDQIEPDRLEAAFAEIMDINVKGYILGARAALPSVRESGGTMIFTTSNAGFYPDGGGVLYTASKHAEVGIIRQLAFELAPHIRVNGVAPGGTVSNLSLAPSLRGGPQISPEERAERIRRRNPLQRIGQPEDHAAAYVLLASDQSPFITGTVICSDGGIGIRGTGVS